MDQLNSPWSALWAGAALLCAGLLLWQFTNLSGLAWLFLAIAVSLIFEVEGWRMGARFAGLIYELDTETLYKEAYTFAWAFPRFLFLLVYMLAVIAWRDLGYLDPNSKSQIILLFSPGLIYLAWSHQAYRSRIRAYVADNSIQKRVWDKT
ncbi:hypothetical protein EKN06_07790 [Croceicoccus ponticola]|uniref:Uncharacterized protein n=1 Tax=Croceicoccus ponticola TaxID=2217664 RepID=A0A437GYR1_9SPHN|nr:hypothetical protein [Croceicoccus ponticola]RVQ67808.1 hypothetical protein EKN06_07790 [Croceicoccus ponticola]